MSEESNQVKISIFGQEYSVKAPADETYIKKIAEYLDEKIYYLGQAYNFIYGSTKLSYLFNGNHETTQTDFLFLKY